MKRRIQHYYIEMKILVPEAMPPQVVQECFHSVHYHASQVFGNANIVSWRDGESPCCMETLERAKWQNRRKKNPCPVEEMPPGKSCNQLFD